MIFAPWKVKAIGALALVAILAGTSAGWWFTKTAYERDISDVTAPRRKRRGFPLLRPLLPNWQIDAGLHG